MKTEINIALIELVISLAIGILTVYLTKLVLMRFYLKKTNEQNPYQNLSFMIFLSGTIFSISYIVFGIMEPLSSTIKLLSTRNTSVVMLWFEIFKPFFRSRLWLDCKKTFAKFKKTHTCIHKCRQRLRLHFYSIFNGK